MIHDSIYRIAAPAVLIVACLVGSASRADDGPFQATGLKIGEVTDTSAVVWTRLTLRAERNPSDGPTVEIEYQDAAGKTKRRDKAVKAVRFSDGATVGDLRQGAPGVDGDVRVLWKDAAGAAWQNTAWQGVDPLGDFTRQFKLEGLQPDARYEVRVESRSVNGAAGVSLDGSFRTAPRPADSAGVVFTVATCFGNDDQDSPRGFKIYPAMARLEPRFFVHTGDIVYYDQLAKTVDLARYHWQRMYSWPDTVAFHRHVASYFMKDDHDTWRNDCWPTMDSPFMHEFTFRQGQAIFREQVPIGPLTYRTYRWGKHLQIWMVEGRDFRSPNDMADGPDKSIWGAEQKAWFLRTAAESEATFRVLVSPTPLVGPDRDAKGDNHANSGFRHEGEELRRFLAGQRNMVVICGDRHWQYMSVDPQSGVREYGCGSASNEHAGGWQPDDFRPAYHRYMKVIGGFLSVTVDPAGKAPTMTLRHHDVDGKVMFTDALVAALMDRIISGPLPEQKRIDAKPHILIQIRDCEIHVSLSQRKVEMIGKPGTN